MRIGFIGLGNMGTPMALNLLRTGEQLVVFDVQSAPMQQLALQYPNQVTLAQDVPSLAKFDLDVIFTMLPAAKHVKSVYLGEQGILSVVSPKALLVDCSTIDPQSAREVYACATQQGNRMLDAPVSGGTGGAQAATLTFMVGGDAAHLALVKPLLEKMGKNIVYCGPAGNGQVAKVANNMLLGISMIGAAEAMSLGVALGMDPQVLAGIINTSSGRCWSTDTYNPYPGVLPNVPASRGYTGGFGTNLMLKDLGLATQAAKSVQQAVPMGGLAEQLYQTFSTMNHGENGELDFSAIIGLFLKKNVER